MIKIHYSFINQKDFVLCVFKNGQFLRNIVDKKIDYDEDIVFAFC